MPVQTQKASRSQRHETRNTDIALARGQPGRKVRQCSSVWVRWRSKSALGRAFDLAERFDDVRSASASSGVPVSAICTHSIHDPLMPDPSERKQRFAGLANLLQLADDARRGGRRLGARAAGRSPSPIWWMSSASCPSWPSSEFKRWSEDAARRTVGSLPRAAEPVRSDVASPRRTGSGSGSADRLIRGCGRLRTCSI